MNNLSDWLARARPIDISRALGEGQETNGVSKKNTLLKYAGKIGKVLRAKGQQAYILPDTWQTNRIVQHIADGLPLLRLPPVTSLTICLQGTMPEDEALTIVPVLNPDGITVRHENGCTYIEMLFNQTCVVM